MAIISHCKICNATCVKRTDGTCGKDVCIYEYTTQQNQELRALLKEAMDFIEQGRRQDRYALDQYASLCTKLDALLGEGNEADWIKHLKRIPDSDKFTDEEICQGLDLQAKRISELEQAIKRIGEHYQLFEQEMGAVYIHDSTLGLRVGYKFAELDIAIADAAKMVEDV